MPDNNNLFEVTVFVEDFEEQLELKIEVSNQETIQELKEKVSQFF